MVILRIYRYIIKGMNNMDSKDIITLGKKLINKKWGKYTLLSKNVFRPRNKQIL